MGDPNDQNSPLDILSQSDIDDILKSASSGAEDKVYTCDGESFPKDQKVHIEPYDFRNPAFLTENEMRQMRIRQEKFIHYLMARLSMFLRMDFSMKMSSLSTTPYAKFVETINTPNFLTLFKFDQLPGVCILEIAPRLAMTIVDRLLGGRGHSVRDQRFLTELEMSMMDDVSSIILEEWCRQWEDLLSVHTSLIGYESSGRFLQTAASDTIMLALTVECNLGDCSETMQLAIPYYTIEPIIKQMQEKTKSFASINSGPKKTQWHPSFGEIRVNCEAFWKLDSMCVADLMLLHAGDVIQLPKDILNQTFIAVEGDTRFLGEVGTEGEQLAVRIEKQLQMEVIP